MRKVTIKMFNSYEEADEDMVNEYLSMPPSDKISIVNEIRRKIFGLKGIKADNIVKRNIITYGKR